MTDYLAKDTEIIYGSKVRPVWVCEAAHLAKQREHVIRAREASVPWVQGLMTILLRLVFRAVRPDGEIQGQASFSLPALCRLQVEKVTYGQSDGVELQLAGGGMLRARRAVITVPLGVLKAGDIAFEPPLPEAKADAISSLGFGVLDKVWSHC